MGREHFLKVPLGKMNNERLVPVDEVTLNPIRELQAEGRPGRRWLLETVRGWKTPHIHFQVALAAAAHDLDIPNRMTPHRLAFTTAAPTKLDPDQALDGISRDNPNARRRGELLVKRLKRIREEVTGNPTRTGAEVLRADWPVS